RLAGEPKGGESVETECAVWAINYGWAKDKSCARLRSAGKRCSAEDDETIADSLVSPPPVLCACHVNPFWLNERLRIQKGTFLIQGDITQTFMENLLALN